MSLTKEEKYVLRTVLLCGWDRIYCYFNRKPPYNCLAQFIEVPANADINDIIWICPVCKQKLMDKLAEENEEQV